MLAQILECHRQAIPHLVADCATDIDPAGLGEALHSRGDRNPIPVDQIAIRHHVAHVDRNAKADSSVGRHVGAMLGYCPLDLDCTTHGIDDAVELDQQSVAHGSDDAPLMFEDFRVDDFAPHFSQRRKRPFFVVSH